MTQQCFVVYYIVALENITYISVVLFSLKVTQVSLHKLSLQYTAAALTW